VGAYTEELVPTFTEQLAGSKRARQLLGSLAERAASRERHAEDHQFLRWHLVCDEGQWAARKVGRWRFEIPA
jgi:hypothetical protein